MTLVQMALDDLSGAETFPLDALMTLRQKWSFARGPLLDALKSFASGADRSPENAEKVIFGLHLMAEKREAEAWEPLLSVAMEGEVLYDMIGDAVSETLPAILLSLYSGDLEGLKKLVEAPQADEWGRVAALECYSALAATGVIPMEDAKTYLASCFETLQPRENHPVWYGWQGCVALLGLSELEPLAARAFRQGFVDRNALGFEDFQADLRASRAAENLADVFEERGIKPIEDALDALAVLDEQDEAPPEPAENKFKNVGRNDPCPCGSGRKYKKCCLGKE
ncbi:DUF1186 domain-containing protein [Rhodoblastus sp.]|uniref:DUF1186 domain-containing protein n=1 Tax=Rhodoblastus sp. TaxID=1962975 RepID=UPI00260EDE4E|nr:DUF1186 domain-containing protein [Rhodoblastus sp.]